MNDYETRIPYSMEIERAIIGAMLIDPEAIDIAIGIIDDAAFYFPKNKVLFNAICELVAANTPIDQLTVADHLKKNGRLEKIGGEVTIATIMAECFSSVNIKYHCECLLEKLQLRQLITLFTTTRTRCEKEENLDTIIADAEDRLSEIRSGHKIDDKIVFVKDLVHGVVDGLMKQNELGIRYMGLDTGFAKLNELIGGFQNGHLIVVAGKTGHGKTSFALNVACNVARHGHSVGIFSLEMPRRQILERIIQSESRFDLTRIFRENLKEGEWKEINAGAKRIYDNQNIHICDMGGININELLMHSKYMKRYGKVEIIIVDYLQLVGANVDNREREVAAVVRKLKAISLDLNIPILALSQFSRKIDERKGEPELSDLRESGEIEQAADIVLMVYNPHEHGEVKEYGYGNDNRYIRELLIKKNRHGRTGSILLRWTPEHTTFHTLTRDM